MKKFLSFLLVFVIVVSLVGCNGGGKGGNADSEANNPNVNEKIIRITADSTPILDPAVSVSNCSSIAFVNLYDSLVFPTVDGIKPCIATKWDVSEDGMEYTFYLKEGIKFHDGSELLASDVAFTTKRLLDIGEGYAYLYNDIIKEAVAIDDYKVKFILKKPFGPFVESLARLYILNEDLIMANLKDGQYGDYGDYGRDFLITTDAGSGPYMSKELVQQDYFYAVKFDDWHMGWEENAPESFKLIYGTEPATVRTMMASKQLEITDMWQSVESIQALSQLEGVSIVPYSTRLVQTVFYNTSIAPVDDINYRRALSCLFDYDMIIKEIFIDSELNYGPVSSYTAGNVKAAQYKYDLEEAKKYLAKSKYADNYKDYTIEFLVNSDIQDFEKVALAFQSAASQVGIPVKINKTPWVTIQERVSTPESTPHVTTLNFAAQYNEAGATLEAGFHSKTAGTYENCHWYLSDEFDAKIEDALGTIDNDERFSKYEQLQHEIVNDMCCCSWIADLTERVAYQDTYIQWPAGEAVKTGERKAYLMGYPFFIPDMKYITK